MTLEEKIETVRDDSTVIISFRDAENKQSGESVYRITELRELLDRLKNPAKSAEEVV